MSVSTPSSTRNHAAGATRTVGEVMRPGIVTCARTATVADLARIMRDSGTDCVVILSNGHGVDQFPVVWGLITSQDLMRPIAELDPLATAEELARTAVVRVRVNLTVAEAQSLSAAVGVSHLLVIDSAHGTPLGIVSDADLASYTTSPPTRGSAPHV